MEYDRAAASTLPKPEMPDLSAWLATLTRFAEHIRGLVADGIESGTFDEDNAEEFEALLSAAAPAEAAAIETVSAGLPYDLPSSLHVFFLDASSEIRFHYAYDLGDDAPDGVPSWLSGGELPDPLFSADKLAEYLADAQHYAANSGIADFPEDQAIWNRSFPFFRYNNSDFLAFDPASNADDPCVIHLNHEGDPSLIARNLAAFLIEWPRICFVGPGDYYD